MHVSIQVFSWVDKTESNFTEVIRAFLPAHHFIVISEFLWERARVPLREIQIFGCFGFTALRNVLRVDHLFFNSRSKVWHASFNVTLIVVVVPVGFSGVQGSMVADVRQALFFPLLLLARLH